MRYAAAPAPARDTNYGFIGGALTALSVGSSLLGAKKRRDKAKKQAKRAAEADRVEAERIRVEANRPRLTDNPLLIAAIGVAVVGGVVLLARR